MNLRRKIAQLFIIGFQGRSLGDTADIQRNISRDGLGGIILFDRFLAGGKDSHNIESAEQLGKLCSALQSEADLPLLIGIDQEGGMVQRLKPRHGFPGSPSARELSEAGYDSSHHHAKETGRLLAHLNINLNFSPVADLNTNPGNPVIGKLDRSFSHDPHEVTKHCRIWLDEMSPAGVLGCLKHFPGHGSSTLDSHKYFVDISNTWCEDELTPYRLLIDEGKVPIIMMGHLYNSRLDKRHPASLSKLVMQGILRDQLGFEGLIVTDDMQMKGITSRYGLLDSLVLALASGADMIIIGNNLEYDPDILQKAVSHIALSIEKNELNEERVLQAHARIIKLKNTLI